MMPGVGGVATSTATTNRVVLALRHHAASPGNSPPLAKLKDQTGSNRPFLGTDPTAPTERTVLGVHLLASPGVTKGTIWGLPKSRLIMVRRQDVDLQVDRSAYFASARTAIKATMRVGFAFPHAAAIQQVALGS